MIWRTAVLMLLLPPGHHHLTLLHLPLWLDPSSWLQLPSLPFLTASDLGRSCSLGQYHGTCTTRLGCTKEGGSLLGTCTHFSSYCCAHRGVCGARLTSNVSYFESPALQEEECEASVEIQDNVCYLRLQFEALDLGPACINVRKAGGREGNQLCGDRSGLETLIPVGRHERLLLSVEETQARWRVRVSQDSCQTVSSRVLLTPQSSLPCGLPVSRTRARRSPFLDLLSPWLLPETARRSEESLVPESPRVLESRMLEIARARMEDKVPSQFYEVVPSSSLELSRVSSPLYSHSSQRKSSHNKFDRKAVKVKEREKRKQRRKKKKKKSLGSVFLGGDEDWLGLMTRQSGSSCPVYLVSPSHGLSPAPCLLQGDTSPSSLRVGLGPHSRTVTSVLLHPAREEYDLVLLGLSSPFPSTRTPACMSPITSKYSKLLCQGRTSTSLTLRTVNRRKCGKLGRDQVCVVVEGVEESGCRPQSGDPVVTESALEGFYLRQVTEDYHVITDLFQLRIWVAAALEL
jgi:hypothetical protein